MQIGSGHRNKIWKSIVEFRSSTSFIPNGTDATEDIQRTFSSTSTVSLNSQSSTYCPGYYEVTRYTFKHTISLSKDDHGYCMGRKRKSAEDPWSKHWTCVNMQNSRPCFVLSHCLPEAGKLRWNVPIYIPWAWVTRYDLKKSIVVFCSRWCVITPAYIVFSFKITL